MSKVVAHMSMSLDGFVADPDDGCDELFGWYGNGDVAVPSSVPESWTFHLTEASARVVRSAFDSGGALVCGRRLFDHTRGWGGKHPAGVPVFVVTHGPVPDWPHATFVTDGVASAIAQAKAVAGDKDVSAGSTTIVQQCLDEGLLDEIQVNLIPVLLGKGIPFFANLATAPVRLSDPEVVEGRSVTHLRYRVLR